MTRRKVFLVAFQVKELQSSWLFFFVMHIPVGDSGEGGAF